MKPNIDELFKIFSKFQSDSVRAGWRRDECERIRKEFRAKLEELGIADFFSWDSDY